ncbi:MAG: ISAs1 family transposase [Desulfovibrio sp.]|jgi:predicted transposase YbfD/YdcC|nr:ISAs1 family transposase [Desulfovibrio sp.]
MATVRLSLWDFLGTIPDPRSSSGRRFSLQSVLGIVIAGILAGRNSIRSIARWASHLTDDDLKLLCINRKKAPTQTTMHEVLSRLDPGSVEKAFSSWFETFLEKRELLRMAIDGKTPKGSQTHEYPALHLLAAYCVDIYSVIMQISVDSKKNEISAAKEMLFDIPLEGKFITGDAIFCQKEICNLILKNRGDYIFIVKNNQKQLIADIKTVFRKHSFPCILNQKIQTESVNIEKNHGRIENL